MLARFGSAPQHATRALHVVTLAVCLTLPCGCGGSRSPAQDAAGQNVALANQRLQGSWTLMRFTSDVPLEPMLQNLLTAQFGRLSVRFDGTRAFVSGVGLQTERAYRVERAEADWVSLIILEQSGASYRCQGTFQADELRFRSQTSPWQGEGILKRAAHASPP
jgi:hypothetical protein